MSSAHLGVSSPLSVYLFLCILPGDLSEVLTSMWRSLDGMVCGLNQVHIEPVIAVPNTKGRTE